MEERDTIIEKEPYSNGSIGGKDKGPEMGIWELDLRSEFPVLFVPYKESRLRIPHSETIEKCSGCDGRGNIVCPTCNADQDPGFYKEAQMAQCPICYGRGLIAHKDGSDTICLKCKGNGKVPCATCESHGLIKWQTCQGGGSLLAWKVAVVRWTLPTRKVNATSGAGSVLDDVFHRAKEFSCAITKLTSALQPTLLIHIFLTSSLLKLLQRGLQYLLLQGSFASDTTSLLSR